MAEMQKPIEGTLADSIAMLEQILEVMPQDAEALKALYSAYCQGGRRVQAFEYLNQLVDVFLDNPPWSGNNTGLAAVDAHLPIVCYPTEFMRGRHSYAILKMLGVTETIADSEQEYIEIDT